MSVIKLQSNPAGDGEQVQELLANFNTHTPTHTTMTKATSTVYSAYVRTFFGEEKIAPCLCSNKWKGRLSWEKIWATVKHLFAQFDSNLFPHKQGLDCISNLFPTYPAFPLIRTRAQRVFFPLQKSSRLSEDDCTSCCCRRRVKVWATRGGVWKCQTHIYCSINHTLSPFEHQRKHITFFFPKQKKIKIVLDFHTSSIQSWRGSDMQFFYFPKFAPLSPFSTTNLKGFCSY